VKNCRTIGLILLAALLLVGCQTFPKHKVHYTLLEKKAAELPNDVLLMPLDIRVKEMSSGGLEEEVPEWTIQALAHMQAELDGNASNRGNLNIIQLPAVTKEQQALIEQHTALYQTVAFSALWFTQNPLPAWQHKAKKFDYTLGSGLSFLAEQTGADTALFVSGEDVISSSGRKATMVFAAAFGVAIPLGRTVVISSLVDLRTGDILWLNYDINVDDTTLLEREDTAAVLDKLFTDYPGLEAYHKLQATN